MASMNAMLEKVTKENKETCTHKLWEEKIASVTPQTFKTWINYSSWYYYY